MWLPSGSCTVEVSDPMLLIALIMLILFSYSRQDKIQVRPYELSRLPVERGKQ